MVSGDTGGDPHRRSRRDDQVLLPSRRARTGAEPGRAVLGVRPGVDSWTMTPLLLLVLACQDPTPAGKDPETPATADSAADTHTGADTAPDTETDTDTAADTDTTADTDTSVLTRSRPRFGAIRWDAWQEDGSVNSIVESTLSPAHWHDRLPGFAEELGADSVSIRGNDPAIMAEEIAWALAAGVDYWAFVAYPPDIGMSNGLRLYLDSPHAGLDFALILQGSWLSLDSEVSWSEQVDRYIELFSDPSYVRVDGERPLVFLFDAPNMWGTSRFPSIGDAAVAFTELRAACAAAGLGSPYLVFMGWDPAGDAATARTLGFDALSTYAVYGGSEAGAPYSELAATARATWAAEASTGLGVVPGLGAGWDPRPRIETPTPWATYADIHFVAPAPEELGDHVEEGLAWVDAHAAAAPARAVVLYAWNEHDEGGWIAPTWTATGPDTARLDAVAAALAAHVSTPTLDNGDMETPTADGGWYVVPSGGMDTSFGWTTTAAPGNYLLATSVAAHFTAAASGTQALLLNSAGTISQSLPIDTAGTYTLAFSLLTGSYPGDVPGDVRVSASLDGVEVAAWAGSTPSTPGVWETHLLEVPVAASGTLTIAATSVGGMPWVDAFVLQVP